MVQAEPPESGWQVDIDETYDGQVTMGALTTTTNSQGVYSFLAVPPGDITVRLVAPAGSAPVGPSTGTYNIAVSASKPYTDKNFDVGPIVTVTGVTRAGAGRRTTIDLTFSEPLESTDALNPANYRLTLIGRPEFRGSYVRVFIPIRKVIYNPSSGSVTLKVRILLHSRAASIEVEVIGSGMSSLGGVLLDGSGVGKPGSNFMRTHMANKTCRFRARGRLAGRAADFEHFTGTVIIPEDDEPILGDETGMEDIERSPVGGRVPSRSRSPGRDFTIKPSTAPWAYEIGEVQHSYATLAALHADADNQCRRIVEAAEGVPLDAAISSDWAATRGAVKTTPVWGHGVRRKYELASGRPLVRGRA